MKKSLTMMKKEEIIRHLRNGCEIKNCDGYTFAKMIDGVIITHRGGGHFTADIISGDIPIMSDLYIDTTEKPHVSSKNILINEILPFLKSGFVAYDDKFGWAWFKNEPTYGDCEMWLVNSFGQIKDEEMFFLSKYFNILPPSCRPEDSLIKIVNRHEVQNAANA